MFFLKLIPLCLPRPKQATVTTGNASAATSFKVHAKTSPWACRGVVATTRGSCFPTQIAWPRGWYLCRFSVVRWVSAITRAVFPTFFFTKICVAPNPESATGFEDFFWFGREQNSLTSSGLPKGTIVYGWFFFFFFFGLVTLINHSEFDPISGMPAMKGSTKWTIRRRGSTPKNVWNLDFVRLAGMWWD